MIATSHGHDFVNPPFVRWKPHQLDLPARLRKTPRDLPIIVPFVADNYSAELPLVGTSQKGGDLLFFVQETMRGHCCRYPD